MTLLEAIEQALQRDRSEGAQPHVEFYHPVHYEWILGGCQGPCPDHTIAKPGGDPAPLAEAFRGINP